MFSRRWLVLLATTQITKAAPESKISPNTTTITSSTTEEAKHVQAVGSDLLPNSTICGISSWFDDFPWMALIEYERPNGKRWFLCGGSLINKRYILTSAGCIEQASAKNLTVLGVRLGEFNLDTDPDCIKSSVRGVQCAPPPIDIQVEQQLVHEDYDDRPGYYHDISLLRLNKDVEFTETVRPICLPATPEERSRTYVGRRLIVAGWGETETNSRSSIKLKVRLPVIDQEVCKSKYSERKVNLRDGQQFCAGGETGRDTCGRDMGNTLIAASVDRDATAYWSAVGVVSFGPKPCGMKDWPSVNTNISAYMPWILDKLRP